MSSLATPVFAVVLVVGGVAVAVAAETTSTSYPEMRRGTRLSQVDSATPWAGAKTAATNASSSEGLLMSLSRSAISILRECGVHTGGEGTNDATICLKLAAVKAIDKFSRMRHELPLAGGVVLVPDGQPASQSEPIAPLPSPEEMPRSVQEKQQWVDKQLSARIWNLLSTLSLRFHFPSAKSISDFATQGGEQVAGVASSFIDSQESNTARKTGHHFMNAGMIMGSSLLPIKLSMLALLVGKALMLSVLAFAVPATRFLQSLAGRGGTCH